jgi:Leucine-rich repeat (LRR) protein
MLINLANAVHWFNPLVWMMSRAGSRDLELVCDELVNSSQDIARRKEYGESILLTVKPEIKKLPPALTSSFSSRAKDLKIRFENIMLTTAKRSGNIFLALIVVFAVLLSCLARIDIEQNVYGIETEQSGTSLTPVQHTLANPERITVTLSGRGINDMMLASMIESGEIPPNVTYLYLSGNKISDISSLRTLQDLQELYLSGNQISNITPLQFLTNLTQLELDNNTVSDIAPLKPLRNLQSLNLSSNQINDIAPLQSLPALRSLKANNNAISDITLPNSLSYMQTLLLAGNPINDITPLKSLNQLRVLSISNLSPEQRAELETALPRCTIRYE